MTKKISTGYDVGILIGVSMSLFRKSLFFLMVISFGLVEGSIGSVSAYWNGSYFVQGDREYLREHQCEVINGDTVFLHCAHLHTYGHALLDSLVPLYKILKENDLLDTKINLVIETTYVGSPSATRNILNLILDIFNVYNIYIINPANKHKNLYVENLFVHQGTPFDKPYQGNNYTFSFYCVCPETFGYIEDLKSFGLQENVRYQDKKCAPNILQDFIEYVKGSYSIELPMVKNRVLITHRSSPQGIINQQDLVETLKNHGYDVHVVDFAAIPIKQQIIETIQSEYMIGVYGSNLVNAVFLQPEAKVMVLWAPYSKYFWSRKYCIIHSAFLSLGITLIEYDKPDHPCDNYTMTEYDRNYFYREGNKIRLRQDRKNIPAILNYPTDMFELRRMDMYIDPYDLVRHL